MTRGGSKTCWGEIEVEESTTTNDEAFELEPVAAAALDAAPCLRPPHPSAWLPGPPTVFLASTTQPVVLRALYIGPAGLERDRLVTQLLAVGVGVTCADTTADFDNLLVQVPAEVILLRSQLADLVLGEVVRVLASLTGGVRHAVVVMGRCDDASRERWMRRGASYCVDMPADFATFGRHLVTAFTPRGL